MIDSLRPSSLFLVPVLLGALACGAITDPDEDDDTPAPGSTPTPTASAGEGTPTAAVDPVAANQSSRAGDYAYDLIRSEDYTRIYVEIDYIEGDNAPFEASVESLVDMLETLCDKPGGIIYEPETSDAIPRPTGSDGQPKAGYTYAEVNDLEKTWRDRYRQGEEAVLYFLFVNGKYIDPDGNETSVIGFAHHGSSMAVFKGTVNQGLPTSSAFYEDSVMRHEVGHLLGLVTTGIPAVDESHVDPSEEARGSHCSNDKCLMHWSVGAESFISSAISGQKLDFDQDCLDDVAAARGN